MSVSVPFADDGLLSWKLLHLALGQSMYKNEYLEKFHAVLRGSVPKHAKAETGGPMVRFF